jgi:hypothetical protein
MTGTVRRTSAAGLLLLVAAWATACAPPCSRVCRQVRACDLPTADQLTQSECEEACTRQQAYYDDLGDPERIEAFRDHRQCVVAATCDELRDGACYDERLFPH